jgi:hypothetical protein
MEDTIWEQYKDVLFGKYGYGPAELEAAAAQYREVVRTYLHGQGLNRTTGHSYTQAASCEVSPCGVSAAISAWTAAVTAGG